MGASASVRSTYQPCTQGRARLRSLFFVAVTIPKRHRNGIDFAAFTMEKIPETSWTLKLELETDHWLAERARRNGRAKRREAASILEAERAREARAMSGGVLHAQGRTHKN